MMSETDRFTVQVDSGLYAGVAQALPAGRYTVGSSIEADLVLVDDDFAPLHLAVDTLGPTLRIEALADGVTVNDSSTLMAGESCSVQLPVAVSIGHTRLRWLAAEPTGSAKRSDRAAMAARLARSRHVWAAGAALFCVSLFVVPNPVADAAIGGSSVLLADAGKGAGKAAPVDAPTPAGALAGASPRLPSRIELKSKIEPAGGASERIRAGDLNGQAATEAVRAQIESAGLLNVTVAPGAGVVTATGTIEPGAAPRWQAVQLWFDERFGGELMLVNGVTLKSEKLPNSLAIEAVWRGQAPHLIIRGQKFAEGSTLEGGWAIQSIEAERVLLKRDGKLVAVRY